VQYRLSRHNLGFWVAEALARAWRMPTFRRVAGGRLALGRVNGELAGVFMPLTYMNLSGTAVRKVTRLLGLEGTRLLVIYDDLDLPPGRLRLRPRGSAGGHRGMESIIMALGTEDIPRLRVGIGRPPQGVDPADYVLWPMGEDEQALFRPVVARAVACATVLVKGGLERAMNTVNVDQNMDER